MSCKIHVHVNKFMAPKMGPKINGLPSDCHPVLGVQGRGCASRSRVGRRPNGIVFFGKSPVFRDETFMRTNHKSSIPDLFRNTTRNHVPTCWHTKTSDIKKSSTEVTLYNMLIDLCCLIPTYLIRTSTLKQTKQNSRRQYYTGRL